MPPPLAAAANGENPNVSTAIVSFITDRQGMISGRSPVRSAAAAPARRSLVLRGSRVVASIATRKSGRT